MVKIAKKNKKQKNSFLSLIEMEMEKLTPVNLELLFVPLAKIPQRPRYKL